MYCIIKTGRRQRYIGFFVKLSEKNTGIEKSEMIKEIRKQCKNLFNKDYREMGIYLTRFDGEKGIIRCNHIEKDNTILLLRSIDNVFSKTVEIKTVATSGTMKALLKKHMVK